MSRLAKRRVLVVGAGTRPTDDPDAPAGNGRAISVVVAREGGAVACADRDGDAAGKTVRLVEEAGGFGVGITADVADPEQCERMVEEALAGLGGLDGLVLNVGIGMGLGLEGTSVKDWDLVHDVNLRSHFLTCRHALPRMADGASIVFMSSVAGLRPGTNSPSYDATKAALFGLCRHVAREGAPRRIRANVLVPGLMDTPIGRAASSSNEQRERAARRIPLGRQGTAWEVAAATLFLLSDEASYITGQPLVVDGGLSAL